MSSLQFSDYEFEKYGYMKPKPPAKNGGLYSGEAFNGSHGNVPVPADVEIMTTQNLRSANPPLEGIYHYSGYTRPGNNKQQLPGTKQYSNLHSFRCLSNVHIHNNIKPANDINGSSINGSDTIELANDINSSNINGSDTIELSNDINGSSINGSDTIEEFENNGTSAEYDAEAAKCPFSFEPNLLSKCPCPTEHTTHPCFGATRDNFQSMPNCVKKIQTYCCDKDTKDDACKFFYNGLC